MKMHSEIRATRFREAERIEAEKQAIINYLDSVGQATYSEIMEATGLDEKKIYNRLQVLRDQKKVVYLGRIQRDGVSHSMYEAQRSPGDNKPPRGMEWCPKTYLAWGGYAL